MRTLALPNPGRVCIMLSASLLVCFFTAALIAARASGSASLHSLAVVL